MSTQTIPAGIHWPFLGTKTGIAGPVVAGPVAAEPVAVGPVAAGPDAAESDTGTGIVVVCLGTRTIPGGIRWLFLRNKTGAVGAVALDYTDADIAVACLGTRAILAGIRWQFFCTMTGVAGVVALDHTGTDADSGAQTDSVAGNDPGVSTGSDIDGGLAGTAAVVGSAIGDGAATDTDYVFAVDLAPDVCWSRAHVMIAASALLVVYVPMT